MTSTTRILHKFLSFLSRKIPDSNNKNKLRVFFYNFIDKKYGFRYSYEQGVYLIDGNGVHFLMKEEPFGISKLIAEYHHFHKLDSGDVVIDAGAFIGQYTVWAAKKVGKAGKVISIEPDKMNLQQLSANLSLNNLSNVILLDTLLWNSKSIVPFSELGTVGSSAFWRPESALFVDKCTITLDELVKNLNLNRLDFIKMDIEGAEIKALEGCQEVFSKFHPKFAIASYHIVEGVPTRNQVEDQLKKVAIR